MMAHTIKCKVVYQGSKRPKNYNFVVEAFDLTGMTKELIVIANKVKVSHYDVHEITITEDGKELCTFFDKKSFSEFLNERIELEKATRTQKPAAPMVQQFEAKKEAEVQIKRERTQKQKPNAITELYPESAPIVAAPAPVPRPSKCCSIL